MISPHDGMNVAMMLATGLAFSHRIRALIKERAGYKSELSGRRDRPLEVAHLDHQHNANYNSEENGILLTDIEHAGHHIRHRGNAEAIGLAEHQNEWAIGAILTRVFNFSRSNGIPDEQTQAEIQQAVETLSNIEVD